MSGVVCKISRAVLPSSAERTSSRLLFQDGGQGEDVAVIVVHDQDLLAGQMVVAGPDPAENRTLRFGEVALGPVQE